MYGEKGVVKKAAGGLFTQIQFQMDNEGTVEVKTGQIILTGGNHGSTAAGWVVGGFGRWWDGLQCWFLHLGFGCGDVRFGFSHGWECSGG